MLCFLRHGGFATAGVLAFALLLSSANASGPAPWDDMLRRGDLDRAVEALRARLSDSDIPPLEQRSVRLTLARALSELGQTKEAVAAFSDIIAGADAARVPPVTWCGRSWALQHRGDIRNAQTDAETCRDRARAVGDRRIEAEAAGQIALLHRLHGDKQAAHAELVSALGHALEVDDPEFAAALLESLVGADPETTEAPITRLRATAAALQTHAPHFEGFRATISLARASLGRAGIGYVPKGNAAAYESLAGSLLVRAEEIAVALGNKRAEAIALGQKALWHERRGDPDKAHALAKRALASKTTDPGLEHDLHRQRARSLRDQEGGTEAAIAAYYDAVAALEDHTPESAAHDHATRHHTGEPTALTFKELAGVLLERADEEESPHATHREALEVIERQRQAELHAHLLDGEKVEPKSDVATIAASLDRTALLHAMILEDRFEWLVTLPSGTERVTVKISGAELTETLHTFRKLVQDRTRFALREPARKLYDMLFAPILPLLQQDSVESLVLVPDGALRSIPFGALMSGPRNFLIDDFAVATVPGLKMVELEPFAFEEPKLLAVGLTESVQGYDPLPHAQSELETLETLFPGEVLRNTGFTQGALRPVMSRQAFDMLHIASHADFGHPAGTSYILTHDDHIRLSELESLVWASGFREDPIELLTLSACKTASGDPDAPLGLAGIAFRAGAKAVVGTLWFINDEASSQVITGFYKELAAGVGLTKIAALRRAQLAVKGERRFRHPYYWAPFTLIGNWL